MSHWRASAGLHRFSCLGSGSSVSSIMCCIRASGLSAACLASSPGSDINEEGPDFQGDRDVVEEEVAWGVHTQPSTSGCLCN
jgi:hypothetical protein